ncbi:hypothetical protein FGRMN_10293 [Fusarium graminum]|nr:hypothetical protein FGRMN_10293 [Fusarium graminum]
MVASRILVIVSLSLGGLAFRVYDGDTKNMNKACAEALGANIDCAKKTMSFLEGGYYGSLGDDDLTDSICTEVYSRSFRRWSDTIKKDCNGENLDFEDPKDLLLGDKIWRVWNTTYIIDEFKELDEDEEMPLEELCHPCYGGHLTAIQPMSPYALDGGHVRRQIKLVQKECSKSTTQAPTPQATKTHLKNESTENSGMPASTT